MFGCPTVCLDATRYMVASKGMRDIQTYGGCPNIQRHLNIWGHPNKWGHPNIRGHMNTPQSDKACFLCFIYVQQVSKHLQNIWGAFKLMDLSTHIQGASKHGVPKHTGEYPNIWGHPNIQEGVQTWGTQTYGGLSKHMWASKYMGASKHMGVSTHIQGASKHRGAQTYQGVSKHTGVSRHTGGCPNMGGIQTYRGLSKHTGGASK